MRRFLRVLSSLKTTATLMLLLALLLLLNVAIPQRAVVGDEAIRSMVESSATSRFVLETLGFSSLATSPLFLALLALFFINLIAVMISRTGPTFNRIRMRPPSGETIEKWTTARRALSAPQPEGFSNAVASQTLRGFGYRARRVSDGMWWGIKHRTAPLGFLVFHLSFFFLCAGGAQIYYTRFVGSVRLVEGQVFDGFVTDITRVPPLGLPPPSPFAVTDVVPTFENGEALDLRASVRPPGDAGEIVARVNHPAKWGSRTVLVVEAGIAPEIWIQDAAGYTVDRVAVAAPTSSDKPVSIAVTGRDLVIELHPVVDPRRFPSREKLPSTPIEVHMIDAGKELYSGILLEGQSATGGNYRLTLTDVRYWAGFRIIDERGGALLIIGFLLGVVGATWRMLTHRREIALAWDGCTLRLAGRSEFFPERFADELAAIRDTLTQQSTMNADTQPPSTETP